MSNLVIGQFWWSGAHAMPIIAIFSHTRAESLLPADLLRECAGNVKPSDLPFGMSQHSLDLVKEALDELRSLEDNLPSEPKTSNHTVGGYFYNQWTPEYARWVKMRGKLAHARRNLEQVLDNEGEGARAESA